MPNLAKAPWEYEWPHHYKQHNNCKKAAKKFSNTNFISIFATAFERKLGIGSVAQLDRATAF